jgi:hypothetical protein
VVVLKVAHGGKLLMLNVRATLLGFVIVGAKLNAVPATIDVGGVPLIDHDWPPPPPPPPAALESSLPPPPQPATARTPKRSIHNGNGRLRR